MRQLSKSNQYWIDHNRQLELKYLCLQYKYLSKIGDNSSKTKVNTIDICINKLPKYVRKYIETGIKTGKGFYVINASNQIPFGRDEYYKYLRKFFYLLDKEMNSYFS